MPTLTLCSIITQLEKLKKEAAEVSRKVEETDVVMAEVDRVSQEYMPLSASCSSIYFTLEGLSQIHFLYQFSLKFFLDVFQNVVSDNPHLKGIADHKKRLNIIAKDMFQVRIGCCSVDGTYPSLLGRAGVGTSWHLLILRVSVQNVFYRVALGMLHDDRVVLGVLLARIFTKMNSK